MNEKTYAQRIDELDAENLNGFLVTSKFLAEEIAAEADTALDVACRFTASQAAGLASANARIAVLEAALRDLLDGEGDMTAERVARAREALKEHP